MYEVTMPKLSDSMEVGKIIEWKVKEGQEVSQGDVLAEVESDKAVMELECFRDGVIEKIVHGDDEEVPVGELIALIDTGEEAPAEEAEEREPEEETAPPEPKETPEEEPEEEPAVAEEKAPEEEEERVAISPYARKLADEKDVDYRTIEGSGPDGRIVARDIEEAARGKAPARETAEAPAAAPSGKVNAEPLAAALAVRYELDLAEIEGTGPGGRVTVDDVVGVRRQAVREERQPLPDEEMPALEVSEEEAELEDAPFRLKTQARRVIGSQHAIPHFYVTRAADVTALMERKEELKDRHGATITHAVMLACIRALQQHPEVNRSYDRGRVIKWKGVNLGLAIETDQGLTVAVVRDAAELSLKDLAARAKELVERARSGKLSAEQRRHPGFTVTNLGMYDVEHFEPIINPPSSITLAVASALPAAVVKDGSIEVGRLMKLTAACDHRIIDGVAAAQFLQAVRALLESPDDLLPAE